jgi:NADH:ubiquinone oxidoreductase subunit 2 (subunit N)
MKLGVFLAISPLVVISLGGVLLMLAEAFSRRQGDEHDTRGSGPSSELALGTAVTLLAGAVFSAAVWFVGPTNVEGYDSLAPYIIVDRFTLFFSFLVCLGGALASLLAGGYLPEHKLDRGEFYPLLTFSTVGCIILASAGDLLSLFLGLETMSLGVYAMTGFRRASPRSAEAAMKYFLLGSFAAALLLYGGALLYALRRHRAHRSRWHPHGDRRRGSGQGSEPGHGPHRDGAHPGRARVQGERRAVPHVDARRLRGRAHPGDLVHGRRREERRLRHHAARAARRLR